MNWQVLGLRLQRAREAARLTQLGATVLLGLRGPVTLSRWERGVVVPSLEIISKMSEIYQVAFEEFFQKEKQEELRALKGRAKFRGGSAVSAKRMAPGSGAARVQADEKPTGTEVQANKLLTAFSPFSLRLGVSRPTDRHSPGWHRHKRPMSVIQVTE